MNWRYNQSARQSREYEDHDQYILDSDEEEYEEYPRVRYQQQHLNKDQYQNNSPSTFQSRERSPPATSHIAEEAVVGYSKAQREGKGKGPEVAKEKMSSWLSRTTSSSQAQFAATALVSGAVVAGAIFGFQHLRRQELVEDLKSSIPALGREHQADKLTDFGAAPPRAGMSKEDERSLAFAERAQRGDYDDELILEQLARNRVFLTDEGLAKLRTAFVIVVGCGGVGSHCTAALARSGVSRIRLIDFDQVTLSSLNRHAVATLADVGTPKVSCLKKRLHQITPWVHFDLCNELYRQDASARLLGEWKDRKPDYVVDAIDNIDSKVALLEYCYKNDLKVISSMGAGCKSDPTRIFIGDISTSTEDPLSRTTRQKLRRVGVASGDLGVLPDFRVRILPVLGTMPAVFGYAVANHVILQVTGYPTEYIPAKGRDKMYDGILAALQGSEEKLVRAAIPGEDAKGLKLALTAADVGFIVEEVYKGRSAISGVATRLLLVRWRKPAGKVVNLEVDGQKTSLVAARDLVCMTKEEAAVHEQEIIKGTKTPEDLYDRETVETVEGRIREELGYEKYR
ncbi:related to E.coli molybdopterin-converting factor chlN [Rhynchosporium agropyri]|uniref:Related to E.coli molybdopterin-converting factor chlN n=1 Tax=Rhynchosporium agropyri TaxID=914238 RepID=A0A1E1LP34_9HELO|nr:related to E.coli molybdopterin-converting factor chlN [Rhynchosporium agropyri]